MKVREITTYDGLCQILLPEIRQSAINFARIEQTVSCIIKGNDAKLGFLNSKTVKDMHRVTRKIDSYGRDVEKCLEFLVRYRGYSATQNPAWAVLLATLDVSGLCPRFLLVKSGLVLSTHRFLMSHNVSVRVPIEDP